MQFAHELFGLIQDTALDNSCDVAGVPNIFKRVAVTRISRGESPALDINSSSRCSAGPCQANDVVHKDTNQEKYQGFAQT